MVTEGQTLAELFNFRSGRAAKIVAQRQFSELLASRNICTGATMAMRAKFRTECFPMPESTIHDGWIALVAAGKNALTYLDECLIQYRLHPAQQLGLGDSWSLWQRLRRSRAERDAILEKLADEARALSDSIDHRPSLKAIARLIGARAQHFAFRAGLKFMPRWKRAGAIAREISNGRYLRFTGNYSAALKDLII